MTHIFDKVKLLFRKDKELYSKLYKILGFYPKHIDFYRTAFAHRSQMYRNRKGKRTNNERLEFLGDAVLEAVVSDIVFRHFERASEGFLTNTRSKLVSRAALNELGNELGIDKLLKSATQQTSHNSNLVGNAFEALVGAIYLDQGYEACIKFVSKRIVGRLVNVDDVAQKEVNFKSKLLENAGDNDLTWSAWFFSVINTTESLKKIDAYALDCIRYLATGKRTKARFNLRYEEIKAMGYRNLVNTYYSFCTKKENRGTQIKDVINAAKQN